MVSAIDYGSTSSSAPGGDDGLAAAVPCTALVGTGCMVPGLVLKTLVPLPPWLLPAAVAPAACISSSSGAVDAAYLPVTSGSI